MSELDDVIKSLNKRYGQDEIIKGDEIDSLIIERIPTGSLSLDIELGGGLPTGRLVEIFGREMSGKTTVALLTIAEAQKVNKECAWIDLEGAYDPAWATALGVNIKRLYLARPDSGEKACDILDALVRSGKVGVVVLDSVAALIPQSDIDTSMDDPERLGNKAQMVGRIIRKLQSALNMKVGEDKIPNDCLVICINQIREKIGIAYGNPETTPGGLALKFYASVRLELRRGEWIELDDKTKIGQEVKFKVAKNKTAPPMRTGSFTLYFDGEKKATIDNILEVLNYSLLKGIIKLSGKTYTIFDKKVVGKSELLNYLHENKDIAKKLKNELMKLMNKHRKEEKDENAN